MNLRLLTRESFLALAQTITVAEKLQELEIESKILGQKTQGDVKTNQPLFALAREAQEAHEQAKTTGQETVEGAVPKEGKAFFTKELEDGLLEGTGDIAVHSLKDLPTAQVAELPLATECFLEDSSDTLVALKPLSADYFSQSAELTYGRFGTSSLRRMALLKSFFPQCTVNSVRGNVTTRLKKLLDPQEPFEYLILATAGLKRTWQLWRRLQDPDLFKKIPQSLHEKLSTESTRFSNLEPEKLYCYRLEPDSFPPAAGQGALGLQTTQKKEAQLKHHAGRNIWSSLAPQAFELESIRLSRTIQQKLEAGCHIPLGVHTQPAPWLHFAGRQVWQIDLFFDAQYDGDPSSQTRPQRYRRFVTQKVDALISEVKQKRPPKLIYTGSKVEKAQDMARHYGLEVECWPLISIKSLWQEPQMQLNGYDWVFFSSHSAVDKAAHSWGGEPEQVLAPGEETRSEALQYWPAAQIIGAKPGAEAQLKYLANCRPGKVLWVSAKEGFLPDFSPLEKLGFSFEIVRSHETKLETIATESPLRKLAQEPTLWIFTSPSAVTSYLENELFQENHLHSCFGKVTLTQLLYAGIVPYHITKEPQLNNLFGELAGTFSFFDWKATKETL